MTHRKENPGKEKLPPLPLYLVRQLKPPAAARAAIRSARQDVAAGKLDPAAAVHRLVREHEVPTSLAFQVFREGIR